MKVGLYFGTFNPIHIGHMAIANYMLEFTELEKLWFVVSPQNPFKNKKHLLDDYQRLELVNRAIEDDYRFSANSIEFSLPKPSYTIDTLAHLQEKYPQHEFSLIMGSDNLEFLNKWKNHEQLLAYYHILVYPRPGFESSEWLRFPNINLIEAPLMEISASFIRNSIKEGKDIRHFLPAKTWQYLSEMNFYK
ncbi:nicotinate (nicotinamide) nucleotide adenylyltransferase [Mangrovibacterium lignilyticum]|uniref:nicotinate (nicotinamide) nucleotide adenylyltransferase n=1 Tax=Mangrovibacterium lignilyticum TaxID=2668052 RepID=UPI0013D6E226|nr:nicotinate (nicotinamide) nucleotide adenylyltransferase [Mangrovibacterium lignilyticum]